MSQLSAAASLVRHVSVISSLRRRALAPRLA